ncbi:MAG: hypothetical protein Q4Q17_02715, partial [Tissierellia bacterium]|nr:hypothetical protein [Tissierellia bacterium]
DEKLMEINQMGFDLSLVSENSIILRAIPMALSDSFEKEMMYDILHELFEERKPNLAQEKIRRRISGIISHGRNDYSDIDFHVLLNNLLQSKNNMVSPTGKQIFYMYTTEKFEKDILS